MASVIPMAGGIFCLTLYVVILLVHFEDIVMAPPVERVKRDLSVVRLPRLYFCPADRYRQAGLLWNSYECKLSFKKETGQCVARLQPFRGEEPEEFRNKGKRPGGECLEFGTHMIGVREEWSAAWNEITLKASFVELPDNSSGSRDLLQEVELGYMPKEWEVETPTDLDHFYSPMLRVPIYRPEPSGKSTGVATRVFLAEEEDKGRHYAGVYWYFYGATSVPVENASIPEQGFLHLDHDSQGEWLKGPRSRQRAVHVVITLDDFTEYEYRLVSLVYSFLGLLGQIGGFTALFLWAFFKSPFALKGKSLIASSDHYAEDDQAQGMTTSHNGSHYRSVASEEAEDEESQALLQVEGRSLTSARSPLIEAGLPVASTEGEGL